MKLVKCLPAALVVAGLALAGCESGVLPTDIPQAQIALTVSPVPVVAKPTTIAGRFLAEFTVTAAELAGQGGEVIFVQATVFDPANGFSIANIHYDSDDLRAFVGQRRIEAGQRMEIPLQLNYGNLDGSVPATLVVAFRFRDDNQNVLDHSLLVKIDAP
jgi:hypothetical protein